MLQGDYVEKLYVQLLTVTSIKAVKCILPLLFDSPSYILTYFFIELVMLYYMNCVCLTPGSYEAQAKRRKFCNY